MEIGILGTGAMGKKLAELWAANGHTVTLGSRDVARAEQTAAALGQGIQAGPYTAAAAADVLLFAFPWYALTDIVRAVGKLKGKVIIDCINPLTSSGSLALGHKWSAGEEIAREFPLAHVVKAFNTVSHAHLDRPLFSGQKADLFYCSDSDQAKAVVRQLAGELGFEPVDAGPIKHARYLESLAVFWIQMAYHIGMGPEMTFKLLPR